MTGMIHNRDAFLQKIAKQLGREVRTEGVFYPDWKYQPQHEVLKDATIDELVEVLKNHCERIHTSFFQSSKLTLTDVLKGVVDGYGGGPIVIPRDDRFKDFGLLSLLQKEYDLHEWDYERSRENIILSEQANIGITFSEITLAESGTVVLFSSRDKGRSVSLLPKVHISIIPKSTIVPRMTQAAQMIAEKVKNQEVLPSCINYITGPSNSADIEMNLVVGVHGPLKAAYIVVDDM